MGTAKYKYVYFDLPFLLNVKDNLSDPDLRNWAEAYLRGDKELPYSKYAPSPPPGGQLVIGGSLPVYIPPDQLAPHYLLKTGGIDVALRFLKRANSHRSTVLLGELPGDRIGKVSFSTVQSCLLAKQIKSEHLDDLELLCKLSISAVNKFIQHYRVITNRPYVTNVNMQLIQEFHIKTEYEDGSHKVQEFGSGGGPLKGFGGSIPDAEDTMLREAIQGFDEPEITAVLDLNIRDYMDLEEWRNALLETGILFEFWLTRFVQEKFRAKGIPEPEIKNKFLKANGYPKSVTSIAKQLVRDATNYDFEASIEYKNWEKDIRDPRNDIAHGRKFEVTNSEALKAYHSLKDAIQLLTSI